ncbi:MAG: dienelactone hydrolase family protein [Acidobacteriota bacterium]
MRTTQLIPVGLLLMSVGVASTKIASGEVRDRFRQQGNVRPGRSGEALQLAGLLCSIWEPSGSGRPLPLVIFSHGFHGNRNQSTFLTQALARAGYLVIAPNHKDAITQGGGMAGRPELPFQNPGEWSDTTFQDRARDIESLLSALKADERFSAHIDWSRVGLAGHSLGGYTVLGLAGAWPSWRLPEVKAVLALSPYANPYVHHGDLAGLRRPVMYQTGTLDIGVAPFLSKAGGAYDQTGAPAYLVVFQGAGHLAWTDLNSRFQAIITDYSLAFLNRYLKGDPQADPSRRQGAVANLRVQ